MSVKKKRELTLKHSSVFDIMEELHGRGMAVVVWTPEEIGQADLEEVEEAGISAGWDIIERTTASEL